MTGPYDRLFRYTFSPPSRAELLLRHNLPPQLTAVVDWPTLRRESGSFVDWERETRKDLLFSARYLHAAPEAPPHFFHIEHQSTVPRLMALRLLTYGERFVRLWHEAHPHSLWIPEVTPLVVFPRLGRTWSAPLRLEDHYPVPGWSTEAHSSTRCALRLEYILDGLSHLSEQVLLELRGPPLVPLTLLVLRFAGTEQLALRLPHWRDLFAQVHASFYGPQMLYRMAHYLLHLGDEPAHDALRRVLHSILESRQAERFMRTMAEVLREEGHRRGLAEGEAKGLVKGKAEGKAEGLAEGLAKAVLLLLAARGIRMDDVSHQRIHACRDVAMLERWHQRALTATRLSEVLDGPA